jgi:hypothetical protein
VRRERAQVAVAYERRMAELRAHAVAHGGDWGAPSRRDDVHVRDVRADATDV